MEVYKKLINLILVLLLVSCAKPQGEFLLSPNQVSRPPLLVVLSSDVTAKSLTYYELDGTNPVNFFSYRVLGHLVRGISYFDDEHLLVSLDTQDKIDKVGFDGTYQEFHNSPNITGNIFDIERDPVKNEFYIIEGNFIEKIDAVGDRIGNPFINTTIGSCVLNVPKAMAILPNGNLAVINSGGTGALNIYNISGTSATCVATAAIGGAPSGILAHSNSYIYITTTTTDRVVRTDALGAGLTTIWSTNTTIISDPTAMVELENGDLAVASSLTDSIERITVDGVRVGNRPFIIDVFTDAVVDMLIMPGVE